MAIDENEFGLLEVKTGRRPDRMRDRDATNHDASILLRGIVIGFGLAAVASVAFNLFQDQRQKRRKAMSADSRIRTHDESGGVLGDLSYIIDESTGAFKDAVQALDKTFETGKQAIDTFQDVIDKIRE